MLKQSFDAVSVLLHKIAQLHVERVMHDWSLGSQLKSHRVLNRQSNLRGKRSDEVEER